MVKQSLKYLGNMRTEACHGPSQSVIQIDAPTDNQGKGEYFSPTDLLCTSLASCMLTLMAIRANALKVSVDGASCELEKTMVTKPIRRIGQIDLKFKLPAGLDQKTQESLERAAWTCPVKESLHPDVVLNVEFDWG